MAIITRPRVGIYYDVFDQEAIPLYSRSQTATYYNSTDVPRELGTGPKGVGISQITEGSGFTYGGNDEAPLTGEISKFIVAFGRLPPPPASLDSLANVVIDFGDSPVQVRPGMFDDADLFWKTVLQQEDQITLSTQTTLEFAGDGRNLASGSATGATDSFFINDDGTPPTNNPDPESIYSGDYLTVAAGATLKGGDDVFVEWTAGYGTAVGDATFVSGTLIGGGDFFNMVSAKEGIVVVGDALFAGIDASTPHSAAITGGPDDIRGSEFDDFLVGDLLAFQGKWTGSFVGGDDHIEGGDGDDTIFGDHAIDFKSRALIPLTTFTPGDDIIFGGAGNDTIDGGGGKDRIDGGADDDTLIFSEHLLGDGYIKGGSGTDTLRLTGANGYFIDLTDPLIDSIEILEFGTLGSGATGEVQFVGSQFGTGIVANAAVKFSGVAGAVETVRIFMEGDTEIDLSKLTVSGNGAGDGFVIEGGELGEKITGSKIADVITGGNGNDVLDGGDGIDRLYGGKGDDTLIQGFGAGIELLDGGDGVDTADWSYSGSDWTISLVEKTARVTGFLAVSAQLVDIENITGAKGGDIITGDGKDNRLDGGGGSDLLEGGAGNDTYIVDRNGDLIIEGFNGGFDVVMASASYDLRGGVHVEIMSTIDETATTAINLYGNGYAQTIVGNAGANLLSDGGRGFSDVLAGLGGNDTYRVYNSGDVIVESSTQGAKDTIQAAVNYTLKAGVHVEVLRTIDTAATTTISIYGNEISQSITGNAGNNGLRGYGGDDIIKGGPGDDKISGGPGNDVVAGNTGADTYYFSYALDAATNVDTISGFSSIDLISLSSSIFTKAGPAGVLSSGAFFVNSTGQAADASDRIIYNYLSGELFYDPDGWGAANNILFAVVTGATRPLDHDDFVIA